MVGSDASKMRGVLKIKHPIERGAITDWNDYYEILNYIFYSLLRIENMSNYPVLYTEAPFVQRCSLRERSGSCTCCRANG